MRRYLLLMTLSLVVALPLTTESPIAMAQVTNDFTEYFVDQNVVNEMYGKLLKGSNLSPGDRQKLRAALGLTTCPPKTKHIKVQLIKVILPTQATKNWLKRHPTQQVETDFFAALTAALALAQQEIGCNYDIGIASTH